jgi:hypothetical protein
MEPRRGDLQPATTTAAAAAAAATSQYVAA